MGVPFGLGEIAVKSVVWWYSASRKAYLIMQRPDFGTGFPRKTPRFNSFYLVKLRGIYYMDHSPYQHIFKVFILL